MWCRLQNSSSPNAFAGLKIMDVGNNQIQGSIPQRVGAVGMDLLTGPGVPPYLLRPHSPHLPHSCCLAKYDSGCLCTFRNVRSPQLSCECHGAGNAICGAIPGGMSVYSCFYNNCTCSAVTHAFSSPDDTCNGQLQPYSLRTNSTPGSAPLHCAIATRSYICNHRESCGQAMAGAALQDVHFRQLYITREYYVHSSSLCALLQ